LIKQEKSVTRTNKYARRANTTFAEKLANLALSGTQLIQVQTHEETRLLRDVRAAAWLCRGPESPPWNVVEWSITEGFMGDIGTQKTHQGAKNALNALVATSLPEFKVTPAEFVIRAAMVGMVESVSLDSVVISGMPTVVPATHLPCIDPGTPVVSDTVVARPKQDTTFFVFKDFTRFFEDMTMRRILRDLFEQIRLNNNEHRRVLVFASPTRIAHDELAYAIKELPYPLPSHDQLLQVVDDIALGAGETGIQADFRQQLASAMAGCTHVEACDALANVATIYTTLTAPRGEEEAFQAAVLRDIYLQQAATWRNEKALELYDLDDVDNVEDVSGYDLLMQWVKRLSAAYSEAGRRNKIRVTRGVILGGIPGTGKSVVAKIMAKALRLPLIILRLSRIFDKYQGNSEAAMVHALKRITAKGRCLVVLDEMDKALGSMASMGHGGSSGDASGNNTALRVFGEFLDWMSNDNKEALIVGTLNRTGAFPPELLRAGRFGRTYFVDMPTDVEREEILNIHMRKQGVPLYDVYSAEAIADLVKKLDQFTGAEIEQVVSEARSIANEASGGASAVPTPEMLEYAMGEVTLTAKRDPEGIAQIVECFENTALPVSSKRTRKKPAGDGDKTVKPRTRRVGKTDPNCN
jgi:AAA+ superfamily predicted ATPase